MTAEQKESKMAALLVVLTGVMMVQKMAVMRAEMKVASMVDR
jgi:hypothetical protein